MEIKIDQKSGKTKDNVPDMINIKGKKLPYKDEEVREWLSKEMHTQKQME